MPFLLRREHMAIADAYDPNLSVLKEHL
jgi:hypothetical protein